MSAPLNRPLSEVLFITEFRDFCRSKGDEEYDYGSPSNCALAQFEWQRGTFKSRGGFADIEPLAKGLTFALYPCEEGDDEDKVDWTFSALAQRLDALLPASVERVRG